jgi:pyruvate,water dikinase
MGKKYCLSDVHMAVVVQKMVDSQISGVLFTANVINGRKDQMMINSTWGLGEVIANSSIIPDMIILEKSNLRILKTVVGKKEKTAIKNPKDLGTITIDTDPELRAKCSLSENQLRNLAQLGLQLEEALNCPQDIEWAIENGTVYVLQSRPITTLNRNGST